MDGGNQGYVYRTQVAAADAHLFDVRKRIEPVFPETIPLVAPPAATTFIVTHEPN